MSKIAVIDLFAGPGGLSEGFSSLKSPSGDYIFENIGSFEKDPHAHKTLTLRHYFHQLIRHQIPLDSYVHYVTRTDKEGLPYTNSAEEELWKEAKEKAHLHVLGEDQNADNKARKGLKKILKNYEHSVLIGGPPCQAYSLAGRARNKGKKCYVPEEDHRHFLYKEYLKFLGELSPSLCVMENVEGILSSKVHGEYIFESILKDLTQPFKALGKKSGSSYVICSLVTDTSFSKDDDYETINPRDYLVRSEQYGIPQTRHRVILLGIREDIYQGMHPKLSRKREVTVEQAILDLPPVRSGMTQQVNDNNEWAYIIKELCEDLKYATFSSNIRRKTLNDLKRKIKPLSQHIKDGAEFTNCKNSIATKELLSWYKNNDIGVVLNHSSKGHMTSDLERYLYLSASAYEKGITPKPSEWPSHLEPEHKNWDSGKFHDRFKVQVWGKPSGTITSHISKDGHHYIHPDPSQCRSFTAREAARIQTFPDNYFFEGPRTQQLHQIGNAVPALLANKIAKICSTTLNLV